MSTLEPPRVISRPAPGYDKSSLLFVQIIIFCQELVPNVNYDWAKLLLELLDFYNTTIIDIANYINENIYKSREKKMELMAEFADSEFSLNSYCPDIKDYIFDTNKTIKNLEKCCSLISDEVLEKLSTIRDFKNKACYLSIKLLTKKRYERSKTIENLIAILNFPESPYLK